MGTIPVVLFACTVTANPVEGRVDGWAPHGVTGPARAGPTAVAISSDVTSSGNSGRTDRKRNGAREVGPRGHGPVRALAPRATEPGPAAPRGWALPAIPRHFGSDVT